ncbi:MAG: transketolase [Gammaproteobacteria bacterium]|nr:transketolase [Gammaproteobacteria bacterium]
MPLRRELANAIRALSMDAIQKANSGHPGAPMGMADIAEVLWNNYLKHNPANPVWAGRDRFVLSNGHASMLLYSLLHLSGYDLSIDDIKQFRQWHSKTPGHPEYGDTPGVETTTGPLGQGIANAVGMAIAEKTLAGRFNRDGHAIIDHYTYAFLGDGCMMEGISHEACSLAGTLGLEKLIAFYDDNGISIDGKVGGWFSEDIPKRFESCGWRVITGIDGHDAEAIKKAIEAARTLSGKPVLICCKTIIGWGSPNKKGKESCHGAPLGPDEIARVRETIGWKHEAFVIPDEIYAGWSAKEKGVQAEAEWQRQFNAYKAAYPNLAAELERRLHSDLPADWEEKTEEFIASAAAKAESIASRKASQKALNDFGPLLPELLGGSADLAASNLTLWEGCKPLCKEDADGNYIYYGVREFGMSAIMNGIALHGGFIPYGATFLVFSEYARNALRMAALMKIQCLFVYTHDSIGLGEDGPTHQPVEQLATLRLIPNMSVWRPCDTVESAVAWKAAITHNSGPTCLIFSRQTLAHQTRDTNQIACIRKGGYILSDCTGVPEAILIATGSEVALAIDAAKELNGQGRKIRVVSMPNSCIFDSQGDIYREQVLPAAVSARVAVEAGVTHCWHKYVGLQGKIIGLDRFGESAPAGELFKAFGFTVENVVNTVNSII